MPVLPETDSIKLPHKSDREGFNRMFKAFFPRLVAYAELFLDQESARDVVQDLMVYIWEQSDAIVIHSSLEAYLFRAVYRRCLNRLDHERVVKAYSEKSAFLLEEEERYYDPESNPVILKIFSAELHKEIQEAIASLPDKCRQAFVARYIDGMKTKEIAERMDVSERTAETHIYHALRHLRGLLKDKFYLIIPLLFH